MTKEQILKQMDLAFKQDRERFFKVADTLHLQPKYAGYLSELEILKQTWRDIPQQPNYPEIKHPMELPVWFPKVNFVSKWDEDYADKTLARQIERELARQNRIKQK